jgi:hypothetical protein
VGALNAINGVSNEGRMLRRLVVEQWTIAWGKSELGREGAGEATQ